MQIRLGTCSCITCRHASAHCTRVPVTSAAAHEPRSLATLRADKNAAAANPTKPEEQMRALAVDEGTAARIQSAASQFTGAQASA